ncbi:MAG TPA: polysaccharide deacetylase family protein [Dictyoglomaceae bacterium]|nr:polysaccharide deacetylase family protein [Dictyoglomaceae bacterium]
MKKSFSVFLIVLLLSLLLQLNLGLGEEYPMPNKLCALAFDDGPSAKLTPLVLEKLKKHNVVATFFLVGQLVNESTKPVIDEMIALGCEIGNHSWAWDSMDKMSPDQIKESIRKTDEVIKKFTGTVPRFFRPPNLAIGQVMFDNIDKVFISGVIGFDWAGCDRTAEKIADNIIKGMRDGGITLLHDVQPEPHPTPEALDIIIPELKKQGYEFVTISELFKRKGIDPFDPKYKNKVWVYVE